MEKEKMELVEVTSEVERRFRVNVSTSVKGIKTYDCTVDFKGISMEETLNASDKLVAELDKRYPPQIG
jgi:hypothetical protein